MSREGFRVIAIIARHELRIVLRGRLIAAYGAILAVLTFAVSYFGLTVIEFTGFQGFERTTVSLLNLVFYIVPLVSMLTAVQSFSKEGGATDRLFTEPVTRSEIVLGKAIGLVISNFIAISAGFGFSGTLIAAKVGVAGLLDFIILVSLTCLLSAVFVAIGIAVSISQRRTLRAYGFVIGLWFLFSVLFDLLIIGLTFLLPEAYAGKVAMYGLFANPVGSARVSVLLQIAGKEVFGAAGAHILRAMGGSVQAAVVILTTSLTMWIAISLAMASNTLSRQDI